MVEYQCVSHRLNSGGLLTLGSYTITGKSYELYKNISDVMLDQYCQRVFFAAAFI